MHFFLSFMVLGRRRRLFSRSEEQRMHIKCVIDVYLCFYHSCAAGEDDGKSSLSRHKLDKRVTFSAKLYLHSYLYDFFLH